MPPPPGEPAIDEDEELGGELLSPEQLQARIGELLESTTYTVFAYTRRGLFDRDKPIVLGLLAFQVLLRAGRIDPVEYEALVRGGRSAAPPAISDDLSRWMSEAQWAAVDALAAVPGARAHSWMHARVDARAMHVCLPACVVGAAQPACHFAVCARSWRAAAAARPRRLWQPGQGAGEELR